MNCVQTYTGKKLLSRLAITKSLLFKQDVTLILSLCQCHNSTCPDCCQLARGPASFAHYAVGQISQCVRSTFSFFFL